MLLADSPFASPPALGPHPDLAALRAYAAGALPAAKQHDIEAHTLDCERCADVLAGLSMSDAPTTNQAVVDLRRRLALRVTELQQMPPTASRRFRTWQPLAAAAALLASLGTGWLAWQQRIAPDAKSEAVAVSPAPAAPAAPAAGAPAAEAAAPADLAAARPAGPAGSASSAPAATQGTTAEVPAAPRPAARPAGVAAAPVGPGKAAQKPVARPAAPPAAVAAMPKRRPALAAEVAANLPQQIKAPPLEAEAAQAASRDGAAGSDAVARGLLKTARVEEPGASPVSAKTSRRAKGKAAAAASSPDVAAAPATSAAPLADKAAPGEGNTPAEAAYLKDTAPGSAPRTRASLPPPPALEPAPVGGYQTLRTYLQKQAAAFEPEAGRGAPLRGTVRVRFTVSAAGKPELESAKVLRSLRADYDAAVLRMLAEGPGWVPGVAGGRRAPLPVQVEVLF